MPIGPKKDLAPSLIRTFTPVLVGLILGVFGSEVAGVTEATLTPVISGVIGAAYYALVRALESRWPTVGVLLGWISAPTYSKPSEGE